MSERRFQLGISVVLLAATVWYGFTMAGYSNNAGRVPVMVALVMGGALIIQIITQLRARDRNDAEPATQQASAAVEADPDDPLATAEERVQQVEEASAGYDVLLALDKVKRRRLLGIFAFSILFYVGALMAGFVVTTGVLITAFLLIARERLWVALLSGLVCSAGVYALVVIVLDMPALDGRFF